METRKLVSFSDNWSFLTLRERETEKEGWEGEVHLEVESTCFRQK